MAPFPSRQMISDRSSPSLHFFRIMVVLPCFLARSRPGPLIKETPIIPGAEDRSSEQVIVTGSGRPSTL